MARIWNKPQVAEQGSLWGRHKQSNTPLQTRVFVAMSGGVDSSVAGLLLREQGYDVTGIFMRNWHADIHDGFMGDCPWETDWRDVQAVCQVLNVPCQLWDFSKEYYENVVSYFFREYQAGRTPNPDVMCNKYIKFGRFLEKALGEGADYIATGHYVRKGSMNYESGIMAKEITEDKIQIVDKSETQSANVEKNSKSEKQNSKLENYPLSVAHYGLLSGVDQNKDQSYFLWTLTQNQLNKSLFPIGDYTKPEVREMAKRAGLPTYKKKDSQGICFIGNIDVQKFLRSKLKVKTGPVVTTDGRVVGEHAGAYFYTEGQREGLGLGGQVVPYYVLNKDVERNIVTVAPAYDSSLFSAELTAGQSNWLSGSQPGLPLVCQARIRYRQPLADCVVSKKDAQLLVKFDQPQRAVTPGQSIVFYQGEVCLGGAIIN